MVQMLVAASILSADFSRLAEEIRTVQKAGIDWIHIDIMDGKFVPNITIGPSVIKRLRPISKESFFDVHLMISKPEKLLKNFIDAGADSITVHFEATEDLHDIINEIKSTGRKVGVSIKPKTPIKVLEPFLNSLDLVLIMTVEPGFGGQKIIPETLKKVEKLYEIRKKNSKKFKYLIQVDGGINKDTVSLVKNAGVDVVVAGSFIFNHKDYNEAIKILHDA